MRCFFITSKKKKKTATETELEAVTHTMIQIEFVFFSVGLMFGYWVAEGNTDNDILLFKPQSEFYL